MNTPQPALLQKSAGRRDQAGMSIGALRTFVTLVNTGSFSKAALLLGVSQPNVSSQVSALEQACGALLIHRRTQDLPLTEAGKEIYIRARLVISRMVELEEAAKGFSQLQRGQLRLGFSTVTTALRLVAHFRQRVPDVEVVTHCANTQSLMRDLIECRLDAAIFSLLTPEIGLFCQLLEQNRLMLLLPKTHPLARERAVSLAQIDPASLILREEGSVTRALTEKAFASISKPLTPKFVVETQEAVKEAVANQLGLSLIFDGQGDFDSRLTKIEIDDFADRAGTYLVSLHESLDIPVVRAFSDAALELSSK